MKINKGDRYRWSHIVGGKIESHEWTWPYDTPADTDRYPAVAYEMIERAVEPKPAVVTVTLGPKVALDSAGRRCDDTASPAVTYRQEILANGVYIGRVEVAGRRCWISHYASGVVV